MRQKMVCPRWSPLIGVLLGGMVLGLGGCQAEATQPRSVREPVVMGSFYPAESQTLQNEVDAYLHPAASLNIQGRIVALMVPHAGYAFSGKIAGVGWGTQKHGRVDTVYVIGTAHRMQSSGAAVWIGDAFRTPLGEYAVDRQAVQALLQMCPNIHNQPEAWSQEHSVEVQVPFLQRVLPNAKLVPLIMGPSTPEQIASVARALVRQAEGRQVLLVASTDLSHYPRGQDAARVDHALLGSLATLNVVQFQRTDAEWMGKGIPQLDCTVCGKEALEVVMQVAKSQGAIRAQVLQYTHSGEVSGQQDRVVGYAALAFTAPEEPESTSGEVMVNGMFTSDQGQALLNLARHTLTQALQFESARKVALPGLDWMKTKRGVFVTLKQKQQLRGCIGMTEAVMPLSEAVPQLARAAAFEDPRFPPLRCDEWERTSLEISVLSPLHKVRSVKEIRLGTDGVMVRAQGRTGLFLPQVAQETGWDLETFLNEVCYQKAHLPPDAWKDPATEIWTFTVQVFEQAAPKD